MPRRTRRAGPILILETEATNTGENVILGRNKAAQSMDLADIDSVLVIGKVCAINYFGLPAER